VLLDQARRNSRGRERPCPDCTHSAVSLRNDQPARVSLPLPPANLVKTLSIGSKYHATSKKQAISGGIRRGISLVALLHYKLILKYKDFSDWAGDIECPRFR
jgi:hypothetical protein